MKKHRVMEIFAGIGAWSKAFERLGIDHEVVEAIEFDEATMDCYNIIHGTNFKAKDVTKIDPNDLPDADIICYSPPCQAFSIAGRQLGFEDKRGVLFFDALRIIEAKRPKIAIMENVKGLVGKKFINEFYTMLESLGSLGYASTWGVLNAKDYGIPQNRERVFIVSILGTREEPFWLPEPQELTIKLKDLLESDAVLPILHNIYGGFKETKPREFYEYSPTLRTPAGGGHIPSVISKKKLSEKELAYMNRETRDGRNHWDFAHHSDVKNEVSSCITANFYKGVPYNVLIDNDCIRKMTSLETMRLMGFSDSDHQKLKEAKKSDSRIYKVCGNSIVVDTVMAILKKLNDEGEM